MKSKFFLSMISLLFIASCEVDNYDPPTSMLTGTVTYAGNPIGVRSGGVQLELWQPGYPLRTKIPVNVDQEGSFSASLFDGTYLLTFLAGNGPWVPKTDTVVVNLKGSANITLEAEPYYIVRDETINRTGNMIEAAFNVVQINSSRAIQSIGLYVGATSILDNINNRLRSEINVIDFNAPISQFRLTVNLDQLLASRQYVFARIGVRTAGVNEMLFSPVFKIDR